jgi:hypothetical protein
MQITGRVLKIGTMEALPDILALPELDSSARNPRFQFKVVVNPDEVKTDAQMIMLLRVYTVDSVNGDLVVIGSCFFEVFNRETVSALNFH